YDKPVGLGSDAPPDAEDVAQERGLYDGAIAGIDDAVDVLLKGLDDRGLTQSTIIVITADHGESLDEPGRGSGHGDHLFGDEGTHVPFVVIDPRKAPQKRVQSIVRDVDLAPTLYELTGVAGPGDLDGQSLVPALGGAPLREAFAYAETGLWFTQEIKGVPERLRIPYPTLEGITELDPVHGDEIVITEEMKNLTLVAKHRMVRDERWKLVYAPTRAGAQYLLFDTQNDPREQNDLAAAQPAEVARLKGALWQWMLEDRAMTERNGWLVPRTEDRRTDAEGVRVEAAK
ncbi:MAG TPA: sulfatase-like hydrolase/transferase, partial [Polyangiaceae bacterium]